MARIPEAEIERIKKEVSFRHAVEILREGCTPNAGNSGEKPPTTKLASLVKPGAEDDELLSQVVGFYHNPQGEFRCAGIFAKPRIRQF